MISPIFIACILAIFASVRSDDLSYDSIYQKDECKAHSKIEVPNQIQDLTFTAFVKTERSSGRHTIFSYTAKGTNAPLASFIIDHDKKQLICSYRNKEWIVSVEIESDKWVHFAKVCNSKTGEEEMFVNGKSVGKSDKLFAKGEIIPSGTLIIGQLGNEKFDKNSRLIGRASGIKIYLSVLPAEKIEKLSKLEKIDVKEDVSWERDFTQDGRVHTSNSSDLKKQEENELGHYDLLFRKDISTAKATKNLGECDLINDYSLAVRIYSSKTEHPQTIYTAKNVETQIKNKNYIVIRDGKIIYIINDKEYLLSKKEVIENDKWTHIMLNLHKKDKEIDLYINGEKVDTTKDVEFVVEGKAKWFNILGQNEIDGEQKFEGRMTHFYAFHKILQDKDAKQLNDGTAIPEGVDIVWEEHPFVLDGNVAITSTTFEKSNNKSHKSGEHASGEEKGCDKSTENN